MKTYFPDTAIGLISDDLTKERVAQLSSKGFTQHPKYLFLFSHKNVGKLWFDVRQSSVNAFEEFNASFMYLEISDGSFVKIHDVQDLYKKLTEGALKCGNTE